MSDTRWLRLYRRRRGEASTVPLRRMSGIVSETMPRGRRCRGTRLSSPLFPLFVSCSADWRASNGRMRPDSPSFRPSVESNCLCRERPFKEFDPRRRRKIWTESERKYIQPTPAQPLCYRCFHRCLNYASFVSPLRPPILLIGYSVAGVARAVGSVQMEAISTIYSQKH